MTSEHCYRHPDRESGRRCSRCGRVACPDCLVQASVGSHCVECVQAAQPSRAERRRVRTATGPAVVRAVWAMLAANLFVFLLTHDLSRFGQRSLEGRAAADWGLLGGAVDVLGEWWRMASSAFLHVDFRHLAMNGVFLVLLGLRVERLTGQGRFLGIYAVSGLGGAVGALAVSPNALTVGASGAVFGLMGAAFMLERRRGGDPWNDGLGTLIILQVVVSFLIPNVSVGGHLGGLAAGAAVAVALGDSAFAGRAPGRAALIVLASSAALVGAGILVAGTWTNPIFGT